VSAFCFYKFVSAIRNFLTDTNISTDTSLCFI